MEFLLDTNAYRNLVRNLPFEQIRQFANELKEREDQIGANSSLNIVVAMELIQHLAPDDPHRQECFNALCLQYYHTNRPIGGGRAEGSFSPPLNVILPKFYFNENGKFFPLYFNVIKLVHELAKDMDINSTVTYANEINTIKQQVIFEKNEFKENLETYLKLLNSGELDWKFFQNEKRLRKDFFRKLQSGHISNLLAISLAKRAHQIMDMEDWIEDIEPKLLEFIDTFSGTLKMNAVILEQVGHGVEALADVNDHRWNTINDVQILFGVLYNNDGVQKQLVTEEKKIKEACKAAGLNNIVIDIAEYKQLLGL